MIFDYDLELQYQQSIAIDDFGNTCLECEDANGHFHYLLIDTTFGQTRLLEFGPVEHGQPDVLVDGFVVKFSSIKFSEKALTKEIKMFINDKTKHIIFANEISTVEACSQFPNVIQGFSQFASHIGGNE